MEAIDRSASVAASTEPVDARLARWASRENGELRRGRFALILAAAVVVFTATYVPINVFSVGRDAHTMFLPGEERLPFIPLFEYLYVLTYFVPVFLWVVIRDRATLRRLLRATTVILATAYATYLIRPVYLERPRLEVSSLHTWLLSLEYLDKPYNHFPSLHVALSCLAVLAAQVSRETRTWFVGLVIGIGISTLFVKQHYIVDVAYGFVLAGVAWWVSGWRRQ